MAEDTLLRDRIREASVAPPPPRDLPRVARRARMLRARRAAAVLIVGCVAAAGVALPLAQLSELGSPQPAAGAPVLTFEPAEGWHVRTTDAEVADRDGVQAWASNVPFAPDEEPIGPAGFYPDGWPDKTIAGLPPDGVVLVATSPLNTRNVIPASNDFPERTLPLELDRPPASNFEGQDPGTSMAVVNATVKGRYVSVRLMFGAEEPAASVVAEAEAELGRLVVAPPPPVTTELDDFGIRMSVPEEWSRFLFAWGQSDGATLYAGTVPLDVAEGTLVPSLGPNDVFVILAESAAFQDRFEPVTLPIELGSEDVCPLCEILDGGESPPADHTLFVRTFSVGERRFSLYAEFGTSDVTNDALAELNGVLASLRIDAHGSLGPTDPGAEPRTLTAGPSFTATEPTPFDHEGLTLRVPAGWTAVGSPIAEPAVAPVVAAFGSWPFPTGGGCGPEPALAALPADAAFVWLVDHPMPANRGDFYTPSGRIRMDLQTQPGRWECGASWPSRMELWRVGGRFLEVHVALGPAASQARVAEIEDLLNSLSVP
jgi:hypothetical protein